jgi:hypothetical protein
MKAQMSGQNARVLLAGIKIIAVVKTKQKNAT